MIVDRGGDAWCAVNNKGIMDTRRGSVLTLRVWGTSRTQGLSVLVVSLSRSTNGIEPLQRVRTLTGLSPHRGWRESF